MRDGGIAGFVIWICAAVCAVAITIAVIAAVDAFVPWVQAL